MEARAMSQTNIDEYLLTQDFNIKQTDNNGNSALILACEAGHLSTVELLLQHKASMTEVDNEEYNALLIAACGGHTEIVTFLIEKGADINWVNKFQRNALMEASFKGHTQTVKFLLTLDFNIEQKAVYGDTALLLACEAGHLSTVELLLQHKASLSEVNNQGYNALLKAACGGHTEILKFLIEKGADINWVNQFQRNALMEASFMGHTQTVEFLLTRDFNIKQTDNKGKSALLLSCEGGHLSTVELLLQHKASITEVDNNGFNALLQAAWKGHTEIVTFLIEKGADINWVNKFQRNALMEASFKGHAQTVKFLLTRDFNIEQKAVYGDTALLLACEAGHLSTVELLLQHKASLSEVNNQGYNALLQAAWGGHTDFVKFLIEKGADINWVNQFQRNVLMEASFKGHTQTVKFLLTLDFNIQQSDIHGNSAILLACEAGHLSTVELLLQHKASLSEVNNQGYNALLQAAWGGHTDFVKFLIEKGADINWVNQFQRNVLMEASFKGHTQTVKFLLTLDFNIQQSDIHGNSAILLACEAGHLSTVELLLQHKASMTEVDNNGYNTLIKAAKGGHTKIVKFLIEKGADINWVNKFQRNALMEASFMGHTQTVEFLLTLDFNIKQTDTNGRSAFELCVRMNPISIKTFAALIDVEKIKCYKNVDICLQLLYNEVLFSGKWPNTFSTSRTVQFNKIIRILKEKQAGPDTPIEQLRQLIKDVMTTFVKTKELTLFGFYVQQKCFEVLCNIMKTKSSEDCTLIGNYLAELKCAEITIQVVREKQLLHIEAPGFICTILQTLKWFSNVSRNFLKTVAQQGVVDLLIQRLRQLSDTSNKEWTTFSNLSAGIILHVLQNEKYTEHPDVEEIISLMLKCVTDKDPDATTDIKLLHVFIDNSKRSWFPEKDDAQMCIQGICQAIENKSRSYKDFNLASWIKILTKMCRKAKLIFEILDSEPLDCLYDGISSTNITEQEAAADCLLAIAEKIPGNFKICENERIMSLLEKMQICGTHILEKKAVSILWLVKRDAIIIQNKEEIVSPKLPEHWKKSTSLGKGTYGCVYLLKDLNKPTSKEFALKIMETFDGILENQKNAELQILLKVSHHRLISYFGFQKKGNKLYLFFEYMPMGSLKSYIKQENGLSEKKLKVFARQILEGLSFLHNQSDNVLLENENSVKLADFGLSKMLTNSNPAKTHNAGTTKWVAPEVLNGTDNTPYDCKADIWSLACTVVEMATTNPPWPDHTPAQHMFQLGNEKKPEYALPVIFSQDLEDFLNKMFQYDPNKRASALELLNDSYVKWTVESSTE
ncbi:alpha-latrotoxin-Lt1a-like isoform X2 [Physella acuta]|uniref:alpha-latrotoxin-Lt1a-like isoform X2 n=1 Tax=Physella acuta TaxID=109671 RepID=UPI0027DAC66F|nr:alpha-latrotoxin-Lt1a-like isoform X2 [Physella acuta]